MHAKCSAVCSGSHFKMPVITSAPIGSALRPEYGPTCNAMLMPKKNITKPGSPSPCTHAHIHTHSSVHSNHKPLQRNNGSAAGSRITSCKTKRPGQRPDDLLLLRITPAARLWPENAHLFVVCQHRVNCVGTTAVAPNFRPFGFSFVCFFSLPAALCCGPTCFFWGGGVGAHPGEEVWVPPESQTKQLI